MPRKPLAAITAAALLTLTGCATRHTRTHEQLNATLWVQTAAEYETLARTAFARAAGHVRSDLPLASNRPPAVVLDIDETALDNSPYQAALIDNDAAFEPDTWAAWVDRASAEPIPGAREFIANMRALGVTPVYITNRNERGKQATLDNVRRKLDPAADPELLLMRGGRPGWTGDKQSRRDHAAERYTVLASIGDDLNDFVSVRGLGVAERNAIARQNQHRFTTDWFLIPNPMYGSWERAVLEDAEGRTREQAIQHKTGALKRP